MPADPMDCAVLGIDPAWTPANPSGVALVTRIGGRPAVARVESSFAAFLGVPETDTVRSQPVTLADVIRTARRQAKAPLMCVAMDIPLSKRRIDKRRAADSAISKAFGAMKCAAHTPNANRPGAWGRTLQAAAKDAGYQLQVAGDPPGLPRTRSLIEVYPHPALLRLCGVPERLKYKDKASFTEPERRQAFQAIVDALVREMDGVPAESLIPGEDATGRQWKACEDALDALVCGWIGLEYLSQRAIPYGDGHDAVWVPAARAR
jgi:predicted RNase H-like nuclease